MIIQVKLENPNFCDGCPCLVGFCICTLYDEISIMNEDAKVVRPEKCKRENSI